jgi:hypothetical protein
MATPPTHDDDVLKTLESYNANDKNQRKTAEALGIGRATVQRHLALASRRGLMLDHPAAMPGFEIDKRSQTFNKNGKLQSETISQRQEIEGRPFEMPDTHFLGKVTQHVKAGVVVQEWPRLMPDAAAREAAFRAMVDGLKEELPRIPPTSAPTSSSIRALLLNQYTITDLHFGMLAWSEENRKSDWDLKIAEKLLLAWFAAAIAGSPQASVGILAQLGDMLHHDALRSVTPGHGHVLDADSRLQKVIRVVIRVIRQIIAMMLQKYPRVHIIMASGNHDEASSIWLREMLAVMYENEPRVTVDNSADIYYAYEWGNTALFYHHGHKRSIKNGVDAIAAAKFSEMFGRCAKRYCHTGHFHSAEMRESPLMKIEQHRTLAAPDAHSNAAYSSDRDATVITYHRKFGETGRFTLSPEMVMETAA